MSNNNMLLKKSFRVRQLLDIFLNSQYFILVHLEEYSNNNFENFRRELLEKKVNLRLINKDDFFLLNMQKLGKGPSVLFYSDENFLDNFFILLEKNKLTKNIIILIKYNNSYMTYNGFKSFKEQYGLSKTNLSLKILGSLNFHYYLVKYINSIIIANFLKINSINKFYIFKFFSLINFIKSK